MHITNTAHDVGTLGVEGPASDLDGIFKSGTECVPDLGVLTAELVNHTDSNGGAGRNIGRILRPRTLRQEQNGGQMRGGKPATPTVHGSSHFDSSNRERH